MKVVLNSNSDFVGFLQMVHEKSKKSLCLCSNFPPALNEEVTPEHKITFQVDQAGIMLEVAGNFPECSFQKFTPVYSNLLLGSVPAQSTPAERSSREEIGRFPERAGETNAGATPVPGAVAECGWGRVGSSGIPGIRRRIECSLCRSLHGVVAVQAGINLGSFLLSFSDGTNFLLFCKQEEELEKMREICEKNQELLRENDALKQVEPCTDTRASWQLGLMDFAELILVPFGRNCCSSKLPVARRSGTSSKRHLSLQTLLLIMFHPK